jgi:arylsulfatase
VLELAGLPEQTMVNGAVQAPIEGREHGLHVQGLVRRRAPHDAVLRGVRQPRHLAPRWVACTQHRIPWEALAKVAPLDDDVWELYDTSSNSSHAQAHDLAGEQPEKPEKPEKLHELQRLFMLEGSK